MAVDVTEADTDVLYSIAEVAERLSVSKGTVFRLLRAGEMPAVRVGADRRIRASELRGFIEKLPAD